MVAVAFAGLALWGFVLKGRADDYRAKAKQCNDYAIGCGLLCFFDSPRLSREENERQSQAHWNRVAMRRIHYENLKAKYERAARYPWLPVEPDPPDLGF
jgi:hypothetical protein